MNIEYGIPIPKRRSAYEGKFSQIAKTILPGGSKKFTTRSEASSFANAIRTVGYRAVIRKVKEEGQIFYRVWRDSELTQD